MKEELLWSQAAEVGVLDKASTLWTVVVTAEVGERSAIKAEWDALTLDVLLTDTGHDLRDVVVVSLTTRANHFLDLVVRLQAFHCQLAGFVTRSV